MDKIKITFENPKGIIISYINIKPSKLKGGDITLELLSEEVQSIEIPYDKDIDEGEIIIKIRYKPSINRSRLLFELRLIFFQLFQVQASSKTI
jgi:hypothetical protein